VIGPFLQTSLPATLYNPSDSQNHHFSPEDGDASLNLGFYQPVHTAPEPSITPFCLQLLTEFPARDITKWYCSDQITCEFLVWGEKKGNKHCAHTSMLFISISKTLQYTAETVYKIKQMLIV
jgi:hypothetical protein